MKKALLAALLASLSLPIIGRASDAPPVAVIPYAAAMQVTTPSTHTAASAPAATKNTDTGGDAIATLAVPVYQAPIPEPATVAPTPVAPTKAAANASQPSSPLTASPPSYAVVPVVVAGAAQGVAPAGNLSLVITPQDVNLRNALDRWLQRQGWQLAWKIDDDLPLEFNATFSGDFDSLLTQVMRATNHMRTPTRVCEHTNNVIRVVARAANCQD